MHGLVMTLSFYWRAFGIQMSSPSHLRKIPTLSCSVLLTRKTSLSITPDHLRHHQVTTSQNNTISYGPTFKLLFHILNIPESSATWCTKYVILPKPSSDSWLILQTHRPNRFTILSRCMHILQLFRRSIHGTIFAYSGYIWCMQYEDLFWYSEDMII